MMLEKKNILYTFLVTLVPLQLLAIWLVMGFPQPTPLTVTTYYLQLIMTVLTIAVIPSSLKYITSERCGGRYSKLCIARMMLLYAIATLNTALYYLHCATPAFFYLGVITWLAMFFAYPKHAESNEQQ